MGVSICLSSVPQVFADVALVVFGVVVGLKDETVERPHPAVAEDRFLRENRVHQLRLLLFVQDAEGNCVEVFVDLDGLELPFDQPEEHVDHYQVLLDELDEHAEVVVLQDDLDEVLEGVVHELHSEKLHQGDDLPQVMVELPHRPAELQYCLEGKFVYFLVLLHSVIQV